MEFQIVTYLAFEFTVTVARLFDIYSELNSNDNICRKQIVVNILSTVYCSLIIITLIYVTNTTSNEVNNVCITHLTYYELKCRIYFCWQGRATALVIHKLMRQIKHQKTYIRVSRWLHELKYSE